MKPTIVRALAAPDDAYRVNGGLLRVPPLLINPEARPLELAQAAQARFHRVRASLQFALGQIEPVNDSAVSDWLDALASQLEEAVALLDMAIGDLGKTAPEAA